MPRRPFPLLVALALVLPMQARAASAEVLGGGNFGQFVVALIVGVTLALGLQLLTSWLTVAGGVGGDHTLRELVATMGGPPTTPRALHVPGEPVAYGNTKVVPFPDHAPGGVGSPEPVAPAAPPPPAERMPNVEPLPPGSGAGGRMAFTTSEGEQQGERIRAWDTVVDGEHVAYHHVPPDVVRPVSCEIHGATGATVEIETGSDTRIPLVEVHGHLVGPDGTVLTAHPSSGGTPRLSLAEPSPGLLVERVGRWAVLWTFVALFCGGWLAADLTPTANLAAGLLIGIAVWLTYHAVVVSSRAAGFLTLEGSLVRMEVERALARRRGVQPEPVVQLPTRTWAVASAAVGGLAAIFGGLVAAAV